MRVFAFLNYQTFIFLRFFYWQEQLCPTRGPHAAQFRFSL